MVHGSFHLNQLRCLSARIQLSQGLKDLSRLFILHRISSKALRTQGTRPRRQWQNTFTSTSARKCLKTICNTFCHEQKWQQARGSDTSEVNKSCGEYGGQVCCPKQASSKVSSTSGSNEHLSNALDIFQRNRVATWQRTFPWQCVYLCVYLWSVRRRQAF